MTYKKYYYRKKKNKKYSALEDLTFIWALSIVFIVYYVIKIYNEKPYLFWFWVFIIALSVFVLLWILRLKLKRKYMKVQTVQDMKNMGWRDFEYFIEFMFKQNWFRAKVWKWRSDWWIDVTATKNWEKYLVQCKKWQYEKIGVQLLREFYWVINMDSPNTKWIYITTSELTDAAKIEYLKIKDRLELWDYHTIESHIKDFKEQKDSLFQNDTTLCEKCGSHMIVREAWKWEYKWKKFYWCSNFPKCRFIKNFDD